MSEHIGPGIDSGPFKRDEADIRAKVEKLDQERLDALYAEIAVNAEPKTEKPKAKAKKK
jgi:hypothetical protein